MYNGKKKAITFSFDDGVTQDIRFIEILDKYGLKCTFNINSELLGLDGELDLYGKRISHNKVQKSDVANIYKNHEVAVHTLTHPNLTTLPEEEIIRQVETDRLNLSELCGYEVLGMAYPCGGVNNDDRVAEIIKKNTGVKFSRTITSSYSFVQCENMFRFKPTVYCFEEFDKTFELANEFLKRKPEEPLLLYIWGHSYEFDIRDEWDRLEELCSLLSGHDDIFYGTNSEILLK